MIGVSCKGSVVRLSRFRCGATIRNSSSRVAVSSSSSSSNSSIHDNVRTGDNVRTLPPCCWCSCCWSRRGCYGSAASGTLHRRRAGAAACRQAEPARGRGAEPDALADGSHCRCPISNAVDLDVLLRVEKPRQRVYYIVPSLIFQNGVQSGFEMWFAPSITGTGCKTRIKSRMKKVTSSPHATAFVPQVCTTSSGSSKQALANASSAPTFVNHTCLM